MKTITIGGATRPAAFDLNAFKEFESKRGKSVFQFVGSFTEKGFSIIDIDTADFTAFIYVALKGGQFAEAITKGKINLEDDEAYTNFKPEGISLPVVASWITFDNMEKLLTIF